MLCDLYIAPPCCTEPGTGGGSIAFLKAGPASDMRLLFCLASGVGAGIGIAERALPGGSGGRIVDCRRDWENAMRGGGEGRAQP